MKEVIEDQDDITKTTRVSFYHLDQLSMRKSETKRLNAASSIPDSFQASGLEEPQRARNTSSEHHWLYTQRSVTCAWPRSARARWLLLCRGHVVLSTVCLAEVMARSAASPTSCGSCTVSSGRRCPFGSRPGVSTCPEVLFVFFRTFPLGLCCGQSTACAFLRQFAQEGFFGSFMRCSHVENWWFLGPFVAGWHCLVSLLSEVY